MKPKNIVSVWGIILLMAGCASVSQPRATVTDGTIQNASLGFFGFTFEIPAGFEVYRPAARNPAEYNELQRMAIRIYELNEAWHPRGNELFYESFLLLSEQSCFLLVTLKSHEAVLPDRSPFIDEPATQWELLPLYNVTASRAFELGETRLPAVYTRGSACEQKGWYYANPKRNSMRFSYEACKAEGGNRDRYILMGFALPENAAELAAPMAQMIDGLRL
jgi:hypothetical protein